MLLSRKTLVPTLAALAVAICSTPAGRAHGAPSESDVEQPPSVAKIDAVMAAMASQKRQFFADELHGTGHSGLVAVLDRLLPDTARTHRSNISAEALAEIIRRLGDDDYQRRQAAHEELLEMGAVVWTPLIEAAKSPDAEISWRARQILRKWETELKEDKSRYVAGFTSYAQGIDDDERLRELVRRTQTALHTEPPDGARRQIIAACIAAVVRSGRKEHLGDFRKLLAHEQLGVATMVADAVGRAAAGRDCPALLLDALRSPRDEVALAAIPWAAACGEGPHKPDVRRLLIAVFEDENRPLRFRASFHLMQTFGYGPAIDYVLTQLDSDDPDCQRQAFEWIGDAGNLGKPADEKLLLALGRLLQSPDHRVRRSAVHALSIYSGEEVVRRLIPLLNDPNNGIAGEVRIKLGHQKDKAMLRRLLVEAAAGGDDEDLRKKAAYALEQLGQEG